MAKSTQTVYTQRGIGLLELMLSLAIISILLVMATRYYLVSADSSKVNQSVSQLGAVQGAIAQWRTGNPANPPTSLADLDNIGGLSTMDYQNGVMRTPWGGTVTVDPAPPGSSGYAVITLTDVPAKVCRALATRYNNDPNFNPPYASCAAGVTVTYTVQ